MIKSYAVLLLSLFCLSACSSNDRADVRSETDIERKFPVTGELGKTAKTILSDQWIEDCDRSQEQIMRELSFALDSKVNEINAFESNTVANQFAPSKYWKIIPFGNSYLREMVTRPYAQKNEWKKDDESWASAYANYLKIKDQPVNQDWIYLNQDVRSLLSNDEMRVLDGMNMSLNHESGAKIDSVKKSVEDCLNADQCLYPDFETGMESFVFGVPYYYYYAFKMKKESSHSNVKIYLEKFLKRLSFDSNRYSFKKNNTIISSMDNGISENVLPIYAENFNDLQREQINSYVENFWSKSDFLFKLNWVEPIQGIFKMFFDINSPGTRAYVSWNDQEVHLFPGTRTASISHEFGHVLGFRDHYYTMWNDQKCIYSTEGNTMDIMSDSLGMVMQDEWNELKKNYSKQ